MADFLSENNLGGQTLLRPASRESSFGAELFRLSKKIPASFRADTGPRNAMTNKYSNVVFDFFFTTSESCEKRIEESDELLDLDDEFQETHLLIH